MIGLDIVRESNRIAVITFNRPGALNALDTVARLAVVKALEEFAGDPDVAAVILTGAGDRAYCAGQDIHESAALGPADGTRWMESWKAYFSALSSFPKPLVHAINGVAAGAGFETVLLGDLRIAALNARFIMAEVDIGLPAIVGSHLVKTHVGLSRMVETVLTGRAIGAEEAYTIGIVNELIPFNQLMERARARCKELIAKPPQALSLNLRMFREGLRRGLAVAEAAAGSYQSEAIATGEPQQVMETFLRRRKVASAQATQTS